MGLVTAFCPLTTAGAVETGLQAAGGTRFVVDCKLKPVALVGHVKIKLAAEAVILSCGGVGSEMLNTVPYPKLPPSSAVPYRVLPEIIKPKVGLAPSLLVELLRAVKLYRSVKPVPSVLMAQTVPLAERPP